MTPLSVSVQVSAAGAVTARNWRTGAKEAGDRIDLTGLDGRVLRLFERWLMEPEREWDRDEIRVFGQLLHRRLFTPTLWTWLEDQNDDRALRLQLDFPADAASSRLAALPWEFLCAPDRAAQDGQFLVLTAGLLLSRTVAGPQRAVLAAPEVKILPVVGHADNDWLGPVDYEGVLEAIAAAGRRRGFVILDPAVEVPLAELAGRVAADRPHVLHYIGHGRFLEQTGKGALALRAAGGGTEWVEEDTLADRLCRQDWAPTVVVLHACEGGRGDFEYRHAGLAPSLLRRGVQSVVAMQYPVTNEVAIAFSTALYEALADHQVLDEAVQTARQHIWTTKDDARLLGVPIVYQRTAAPLLGRPGLGGGPA